MSAVTINAMSSIRLKAKRPQKMDSLSVPVFFILISFEFTVVIIFVKRKVQN